MVVIDWIRSHPVICWTIVAALVFVVSILMRSDKVITVNGGQEAETPDEVVYTKISIFANDGKLLETVMIDDDSLTYDNKSFAGTTEKGKEVEYLTTGFLVKIEKP